MHKVQDYGPFYMSHHLGGKSKIFETTNGSKQKKKKAGRVEAIQPHVTLSYNLSLPKRALNSSRSSHRDVAKLSLLRELISGNSVAKFCHELVGQMKGFVWWITRCCLQGSSE